MFKDFIVATLVGWFAWQTPAPTPMPVPSPSETPTATASPSPAPTVSSIPSPTPTASPLPTPLVLPPEAAPQILAVQVSDPVLRSGETFTGTVITSTNVASVEVRLAGHAMRLRSANPGVWQISHVVPQVPFFLRRRYNAQIIASNTAGAQAAQQITLTLR